MCHSSPGAQVMPHTAGVPVQVGEALVPPGQELPQPPQLLGVLSGDSQPLAELPSQLPKPEAMHGGTQETVSSRLNI